MDESVSIAIETSCRQGGLALGIGDNMLEVIDFDASARHATQLVARCKDLLVSHKLTPKDLDHVYVSAGPGSFTGIRVGVTVARTLGQLVSGLKCVGVPTAWAVAYNARELDWENLAVVFDAKEGYVYSQTFTRSPNGVIQPHSDGKALQIKDFLTSLPKPATLIGEGLSYHDCSGPQITVLDENAAFPTPAGIWCVGRQIAETNGFTPYAELLPIYSRKPEAVRLWEKQNPGK